MLSTVVKTTESDRMLAMNMLGKTPFANINQLNKFIGARGDVRL